MNSAQHSELERALINNWQGGFPLTPRPFAEIAATLNHREEEVLATLRRLLEQRTLTRFGPLYNAERMGGSLTLAAMQLPEKEFEAVAALVNDLPETAHNYRRDHALNMWFVLATDSPLAMEQSLQRIERESGYPVYAFPKEREYYLGLWFEIGANGERRTRSLHEPAPQPAFPLTPFDRAIVRHSQAGLPLTLDPWGDLATQLDSSRDQLLERIRALLASGAIRRIGLVPNHYQLGFCGNGMSVWDIPDAALDRIGQTLGNFDCVSHCYARPRHLPLWRYNLFAMVHGRDRKAVTVQIERIATHLGNDSRAHEILFSSALLKKSGMRV